MTDVLDRLLSDLNQINYEWVKANADPMAMSLGIEAKLTCFTDSGLFRSVIGHCTIHMNIDHII